MNRIWVVVLVWLLVIPAKAQWTDNPAANSLIRRTASDDNLILTVGDGRGGAIFILLNRPDSLSAQRISADGFLLWGTPADSRIIKTFTDQEEIVDLAVEGDGNGGVYVCWASKLGPAFNYSEIFIQHIDSNGSRLWGNAGIQVTPSDTTSDIEIRLAADGTGDVYAAWRKTNFETYAWVYVQRISAEGELLWGDSGINVCSAAGNRGMPALAVDSTGILTICFTDTRHEGIGLMTEIYGQRFNAAGVKLWPESGLWVAGGKGQQILSPNLLPDGKGGVVMFMEDYRNDVIINRVSTNSDIYAQRVDSNGVHLWAHNALPICTTQGMQRSPKAVKLSGGYICVTWRQQIGYDYQVFGQRMDTSSSKSWATGGLWLTSGYSNVYEYDLACDNEGNVVLAFKRNQLKDDDILAQKVGPTGEFLWGTYGTLISNAPRTGEGFEYLQSKSWPKLAQTSNGNFIIAWNDNRHANTWLQDIYASMIKANGTLAFTLTPYTSIKDGFWTSPSTWAGGQVPDIESDVIIRHQVIVNGHAQCKSIKIDAQGSKIIIEPGMNLEIKRQ
jgi:hypothetical protein